MAGKSKKITKIKLVSTEGTGYFYTTTKGKNITGKLKKMKFDPRAVNAETGKKGKHVLFEETKI